MKISVIGAGAMGGATVEGLIKGQQFRNEDVTVSDPSQAVVEKFARMGISVTTDNKLAADAADIVCVVVKPWLVERVLKDIKPELDPNKQILIVIAAGVSSASIQEWLGENCPPIVPRYSQHRNCRNGLNDIYRSRGGLRREYEDSCKHL